MLCQRRVCVGYLYELRQPGVRVGYLYELRQLLHGLSHEQSHHHEVDLWHMWMLTEQPLQCSEARHTAHVLVHLTTT